MKYFILTVGLIQAFVTNGFAQSYIEWSTAKFGIVDAQNQSISGENADPDADGESNLAEYLYDSDPLVRDPEAHPQASVDAFGNLVMKFARRKSHAGYAYVPLVTSKVDGPWQFNGPWVEGISVTSKSQTADWVTVRDSKSSHDYAKRFVRLMVGVDTDGDGLIDSVELANGLNPNDPSDANADSDGDGLVNWKEIAFGLNLTVGDDAGYDPDADGLLTSYEINSGLDPDENGGPFWDSDGDGQTDIDEFFQNTDPSDPFNGSAAVVRTYGGNQQIGWTESFLPEPIEFRVVNQSGQPVQALTVHVTVENGQFTSPYPAALGLLQEGYVETDAEGFVRLRIKHGDVYNSDCTVFVSFGLGAAFTSLTYTSRILGNPAGVAAPSDVEGDWDALDRFTVTWVDNSADEMEFVIERKLDGETEFTPVARVPANTTQWVDESPPPGQDVIYTVNSTR
jgi:hypothetical protein